MIYQICEKKDVQVLIRYLFEHKDEITPSAIEQMYMNESAVGMRIEHKMEISILAINDESHEVQGVISAISPNVDQIWTIVALHVLEKSRRHSVATNLIKKLKEELQKNYNSAKCQVSLYNSNRRTVACLIINGFEIEGKISAIEKEKELIVFGLILQ